MKKGPTKTYKEREQAARVTSAAHRADIARPAGLVGVQRVDSKLRSRIDDVLELGLGKQKCAVSGCVSKCGFILRARDTPSTPMIRQDC